MKKGYYKIQLTVVGYLFIALTVGVGIAALNTGNNLLYLTFGMMLSFIILSGILSNNTLHDIELDPAFPKRIFANTVMPISFDVRNRKKRFPSYAINIFPSTNKNMSSEGAFLVKIPPRASKKTQAKIQFTKRGYHPLPDFRIETSYPFGLLKKFRIQNSQQKSLVYPALVDLPESLGLENQYMGDVLSDSRGESGNPYGIRDFVYGDAYRFIHWKSSAKQGKLHLKEFENEKRMSVEVDLRLDPHESPNDDFREKAVSLAASFIQDLMGRGIDVFLRINGDLVAANHLDEMLTELAICQAPLHEPDYKALTREKQTIVLSDMSKSSLPSDTILSLGREEIMDYA